MKLIALLHTWEFHGDHSSDVCRVCEIGEGETVQQLAERLFIGSKSTYHRQSDERIEIKIVEATKP